jgi:hypothetical protein
LCPRSVAPGDIERATAVVTNFTDSWLPFWDGATMSAGEAAHAVVIELFVQPSIGFANSLVENTAQGGHDGPWFSF